MTDNQARASSYLSSIRNIEKRLNNKRLELDALRYKASGAGAIRYDKDRVQTTPEDFLVKAMNDIIRIEKQIEKEEKAAVKAANNETNGKEIGGVNTADTIPF